MSLSSLLFMKPNRIPKIIHYCWLSENPFPKNISQYLQSWTNMLPDYELMLWDLNKDHIGEKQWVKEAFEAKKYAYAADYIRVYALYHYGGIYLDTDVEVIKKFDDLLHLPYFVGTEGGNWIEAAILGSEKGADWLQDILPYFDKPFIKSDGTFDMVTMPQVMNTIIGNKRTITVANQQEILQNIDTNYNKHFYLFPEDYFSPKNMGTGAIKVTVNTYAIHHFAMSWIPTIKKILPDIKRILMKVFGVDNITAIIRSTGLSKN